ncbi:polymer-forming cytoskeletal protein [Rhodospirillaceae bacterium SYSU D60014]|uniref:bactofilin family protein n=1 Tax=Virgifigura deserti TaxID=2268457 RepID=UPI000E661140
MADFRVGQTGPRPEFGQRGIDIPTASSKSQTESVSKPQTESESKEPEGSKLIVGRNIHLKGEITACDTLVVEGRVEASMKSRVIEIDETGLFSGSAEVENADIRGRFEGDLMVSGRLSVHATGRVSGSIRYGEIVIASGGQIAGDVRLASDKRAADKPAADKPTIATTQKPTTAWQAEKPAVAAAAKG